MIKHLKAEGQEGCLAAAELMQSRRSEVALLGANIDRQGIRFSSTRYGHHGCSQSAVLAGFCCGGVHVFCPEHAYCPLCHVWQPSDAIWVDEDCCAYGKCRMGSLCGFCEGVLETKNEQTQQAALILQQKFGRPLRIVAKEGGAEVPLEPVRGVLPGAFGKEPERVVRSWMVMPYPELCPWPVEKPKKKSDHLHRQPSGGEDQDRGRAVADNLHVGGGDRDEGCAVADNLHVCAKGKRTFSI